MKLAASYLLMGALATCLISAGIVSGQKPAPEVVTDEIICVDDSGSMTGSKKGPEATAHDKAIAQAFKLGTAAGDEETRVTVFGFASATREIYRGFPDDPDTFEALLERDLTIDPTPGTNYPLVFERVARAVKQSHAKIVQINLIGDGLDDFEFNPAAQQRLRAAAEALSADLRVHRVVISGVASISRAHLRSALSALSDRLVLLSDLEDPASAIAGR